MTTLRRVHTFRKTLRYLKLASVKRVETPRVEVNGFQVSSSEEVYRLDLQIQNVARKPESPQSQQGLKL